MTGNDFAERREIYCNNTIRQNGLVKSLFPPWAYDCPWACEVGGLGEIRIAKSLCTVKKDF